MAKDMDLVSLAKETEGCTGADIEAICRKAIMLAIREYLETYTWGMDSGFSRFSIRMAHLERARELIVPPAKP